MAGASIQQVVCAQRTLYRFFARTQRAPRRAHFVLGLIWFSHCTTSWQIYAKNVHLCNTRNCCGAFCFKENINKIILNNKFPCQKYFCKHVFDYYDVAYDRRILIMTFWSSSFVITPHLSPCQILKCSYANFDTHILFKNKNVTLCPVPLFQMFYWLPETLTMFPFFLVLLLNDKLTGRPDWTRTY